MDSPIRYPVVLFVTLQPMRKHLAILFLIVFSFQVLPMKTIGKLLVKGQTEEEVKHGCDDGGDDMDLKTGKYNDLIAHSYTSFSVTELSVKSRTITVHYSDVLPVAHVAEIPSPPPNC